MEFMLLLIYKNRVVVFVIAECLKFTNDLKYYSHELQSKLKNREGGTLFREFIDIFVE